MEEIFESLRDVIANETCRLVPKVNPDSFELVKSGKHGQNVYAKINTRASGRVKCKISELDNESKKRIPLEELIHKSFEGSYILKLIKRVWVQLNLFLYQLKKFS